MAVSLLNEHPRPVRFRTILAPARRLLQQEGLARAGVSVLLTGDSAVHDLNLRYRGYDKPTDVLSFAQRDLQAGAPPAPALPGERVELGDVIISVDTAARQAVTHGVTLEEELALLAVHGVLHLLGYEDETDEGIERMRARERELGVRKVESDALDGCVENGRRV